MKMPNLYYCYKKLGKEKKIFLKFMHGPSILHNSVILSTIGLILLLDSLQKTSH